MLYLNCSSLALHIGWLQKLSKKVVMMERYYPFFCWGLALLFFHSFLPFQLIGLDNKSLVAIWFTCFICNGSIAFLKYYEVLTTKKKEPELLALRPGLVGEYLLVLAKEKSNKLIFHAAWLIDYSIIKRVYSKNNHTMRHLTSKQLAGDQTKMITSTQSYKGLLSINSSFRVSERWILDGLTTWRMDRNNSRE